MFYVDTSVLVAYYYPESISGSVEKLLLSSDQLYISSLTEVEFFFAFSKKLRTKEISRKDTLSIFTLFRSHVESGLFTKLSVKNIHFNQARDYIRDLSTPLRSLDAMHLGIASLENLTIFTADKLFSQSAKKLGCSCKLVT